MGKIGWKKCTASLFKPSFMLPSSFSDSNLSRSYLYSRDFGKTPFIPDRSHNFPPILMEHRRGHVSSTFHRALINPDIVDLPFPHIHDFLPESGREPCFLAGFLAGNSNGGRKNKKANPGKLDRERGCCTPDLPGAAATIRAEIPDYLSATRVKPRKIASARAFKITLRSWNGRNNDRFNFSNRKILTNFFLLVERFCISFYFERNRLVLAFFEISNYSFNGRRETPEGGGEREI